MTKVNLNNDVKIFYPRGCGGRWLGNLIWHLETQNWDFPKVDTVFDNEIQGSIPVNHLFEVLDPSNPNQLTYANKPKSALFFSSPALFNHYINVGVKVRFHLQKLNQQSLQQQFFTLSNSAKYLFTNQLYHDAYCNRPDLDYQNIFCDPQKFASDLFNILSTHNIKYAANKDYVLASIKHYVSTCPNPADHYGNNNSLLWLGCCHAVSLIEHCQLNGVVTSDVTLEDVQTIMEPLNDLCKQYVSPLMFNWSKL